MACDEFDRYTAASDIEVTFCLKELRVRICQSHVSFGLDIMENVAKVIVADHVNGLFKVCLKTRYFKLAFNV